MGDIDDRDLVSFGVDLIEHAVGAPSSTADAGERADQLSPDTPGFLEQRTGDELDDGRGYSLGKLLCDCSRCRTGDDELEWNLVSVGHEAI
jgi:hypothetical protein